MGQEFNRNYRTFIRNWWRVQGNELVPNDSPRRKVVNVGLTLEEAREMCREYNTTHEPGRLSRKMELETY